MASTRITVRNKGSLRIEGDFTIVDPEGKEYGLAGRTVISLCRCGHSQNKPFCDGSHRRVEFGDEPHAHDLPAPEAIT
jgi:CDGSH-type Zn-finger protein